MPAEGPALLSCQRASDDDPTGGGKRSGRPSTIRTVPADVIGRARRRTALDSQRAGSGPVIHFDKTRLLSCRSELAWASPQGRDRGEMDNILSTFRELYVTATGVAWKEMT